MFGPLLVVAFVALDDLLSAIVYEIFAVDTIHAPIDEFLFTFEIFMFCELFEFVGFLAECSTVIIIYKQQAIL